MQAYYAPGRPRIMGDYDFAVPEERFDRAVELLLENGNRLDEKTGHSFSLKGDRDQIDLHRWIFKTHNERFAGMWERAEPFHFHGVDVRVPAQEDMFIHLMHTRSDEYLKQEKPMLRMQWLYDCRDIWAHSGGLDLERLAVRAREFHAESEVRMMLRLFMRCFPELIKPEEFERCFPRTPEYDRFLVNGGNFKKAHSEYRSHGYNEQSAMTPINVWRGLRYEMSHYRYLKPELQWVEPGINFFRFIKIVRHIEGFSDLAKRYFSRIRLFEKREGGD